MARITKRCVEKAEPASKEYFIWDEEMHGFGLRVYASGQLSFVVQYRTVGRTRRMSIGKYPATTADEARKAARQLLAAVDRGEDPSGLRQDARNAPSVKELCKRYLLEHVEKRNSARTAKEFNRIVERHIKPALGTLKVEKISRQDIARLHASMSATPRQANHTLSVLSKMFSLAELWGLRPDNTNPCRLIARYPETMRERFLSNEELARLGRTLIEGENQGTIPKERAAAIRLLALTGCRLSEILELTWAEVDLEHCLLHLSQSKTGPRLVVLGTPAKNLLKSLVQKEDTPQVLHNADTGQPISVAMMENIWRRVRNHAELSDVRLHDLRHTVGTFAGQTGANAFLVRDKLGHKTLAMTGRYVSRDVAPLRSLSDQVERRIADALEGTERGKVLPFNSV